MSKYPPLLLQEIFMRQYLMRMNGADVTAEEVNQLNGEVEAFTLASHLFWSLWAVVNAAKSQIPFGYWVSCLYETFLLEPIS